MTVSRTVLLLGSALVLAACNRSEAPEPAATAYDAPADEMPAAPMPMRAEPMQNNARALVILEPVGDSGAGGQLQFTMDADAVLISGTLTGLEPGSTHGFHVHETGDCSADDASSAGGHFNPAEAPHGNRETAGAHHAGDMPNQSANDMGEASVNQRLEGLGIATGGDMDIVGKAVIVHAQADDYTTQPTGDAGGRIACGVIVADATLPSEMDAVE